MSSFKYLFGDRDGGGAGNVAVDAAYQEQVAQMMGEMAEAKRRAEADALSARAEIQAAEADAAAARTYQAEAQRRCDEAEERVRALEAAALARGTAARGRPRRPGPLRGHGGHRLAAAAR